MKNILKICVILLFFFFFTNCGKKWSEKPSGNFNLIENKGGQTLGYDPSSGLKILTVDGFAFKDLNKNGTLDKYEDWRLSIDERAKDLAAQMSIEEIAGLMLYSAHQSIPARSRGYFSGTYNGKPYTEGETDPSDLSDQQKKFLAEDNLRHVLITTVKSPEIAAKWNNKLQSFCESVGKGIPANNSSDPRHATQAKAEFDAASGGEISMWPNSLGMAATFDPAIVKKFAEIASKEYRALGITTALSPQVDIPDENRPSDLAGSSAIDRVQGASETYGTLRYGKLVELLMYDCRRFITLTNQNATFIPQSTENWLINRTNSKDVKHTIHVPSTPYGWSAGKWLEWYPDVLGKDKKLHGDLPKFLWQKGWQAQHDRLINAMYSAKHKTPIVLSGDIHTFAAGKIHRNGNLDMSNNPIHSFIAGTLGCTVFPSTFRKVKAAVPTVIGMEESFENQEENGFSMVDINNQSVQIKMYKYLWSRDDLNTIPTLESFQNIKV